MKKIRFLIYFQFICLLISCEGPTGPSGINSLIETLNEPIGINCEFGGLKVISGLDRNDNGILDGDEISKTDFVCCVAGNNS